MFLFNSKALAGIGMTAAAVASTALFAMPAQAASAGLAKVVGSSTVQFNALLGKSNDLTVTISGRTVTLNDKVAIKAGKGCKAVKGDKTKVKCKTKKKTAKINAFLGDKNDRLTNKTSVAMLADGGSANDTLTGGSGKDQLQGGTGTDKLYGKAGNDTLISGSGNDYIVAGTGNDLVDAGSGADTVYGEAGNDRILGSSGKDRLVGGAGNDLISGSTDVDTIYGEAGNDEILGGTGNDVLSGAAGDDTIVGETGDDRITGGAGQDLIYGEAGTDTLTGDAGNDYVSGEAGNDRITGGDGDDGLLGEAGNDTIAGNAGDDVLVGEDALEDGTPFGSDSALDRLDGGTQNPLGGDVCLVMAAGTTVNCEPFPAEAAAARTLKATESADSIKAGLQAQARASTVEAAK